MPDLKLKPCPFCGSENWGINGEEVSFIGENSLGQKKVKYSVYVMCNCCFSKGKPITFDYWKGTKEGDEVLRLAESRAVEHWNKRGCEYGN